MYEARCFIVQLGCCIVHGIILVENRINKSLCLLREKNNRRKTNRKQRAHLEIAILADHEMSTWDVEGEYRISRQSLE